MSTDQSDRPNTIGLILNYRNASTTYRCIQSLLTDGIEHILIWDNSADAGTSSAELSSLLSDEEISRVSIEVSPRNLGFAAGVNRGLDWIKARYPNAWVLLMNNDAATLPGTVEALTSALMSTHSAVIAYPGICQKGNSVPTLYYHRILALVTKRKLPGSIPYASGCCQLLAPERLRGPWFDEDFFMYGEDVELSYRLGEQGIAHVPNVWVVHEGNASSRIGSPFYETYVVAGHWLLARKLSRNRWEFGLCLLGRGLTLPARALLRTVRYRSLIPLISLYRGWRLARSYL